MKGRALLAWNLRRLRAEREISQERLAYDAGVDRAYISELERERGNATLDLLDKLARILKVPHSEFLQRPETGAKRPKPLASGRPKKSVSKRSHG